MTTLILHRDHLSELIPLLNTFTGAGDAIVLQSAEKLSAVCQQKLDQVRALAKQVIIVEGYDRSSTVEEWVNQLSKQHSIRCVFAAAEFDLYRAERIKAWLGLEYLNEHDLQRFRNKIAMKDHFSAQGIHTTEYQPVKSVLDVYDFVQTQGFPVVFKQQEGGGGVGAKVLHSHQDISQMASLPFRSNGYTEPALMVESYTQGQLYHVDSLVYYGELIHTSACCYVNGLLEDFEKGHSEGGILLPNTAPQYKKLEAYHQNVIEHCGLNGVFSFHAEYFVHEERITLCEIACRTGGEPINTAYRILRNVDINGWLLNTLYHKAPWPIQPENLNVSGGWVCTAVGHEHRRIVSVPQKCELPFVEVFEPQVIAGECLKPSVSSSQGLCYGVFTGATESQALDYYHTFEQWMKDSARYEVI